MLAVNGASAALTVSSIPWAGPIGAVRVSVMDGVPVLNPSDADIAASDLTLFYAGTEDRTLMIEAQAMKPAGVPEAGGVLTTGTRPTSNLIILLRLIPSHPLLLLILLLILLLVGFLPFLLLQGDY